MNFIISLIIFLPIFLISSIIKETKAERQREERQRIREENRMQQIRQNESFVSSKAYEISRICCAHDAQIRLYDWITLADKKPPFAEGTDGPKTFRVRAQIDELLCGERPENIKESKRKKYQNLLLQLSEAEREEAKVFKEWEVSHNIAIAVLTKDYRIYEQALEFAGARSKINNISNSSRFNFKRDSAYFFFQSNAEEVIPIMDYSLTKAGNVSQRSMGRNKRCGLICEYVCSSVLCAAQAIFSTLPISMLRIDADAIIEDAYGEKSIGPVVSLSVDRQTFFNQFDSCLSAVDQLTKYGAIMDILKTRGFKRIKVTDPDALELTELEAK